MAENQQIGITGEVEPLYCGCGCGEEVRGRHSVSHSLGGGKYTLYLAKHDDKWNDDHPAQVDEPLPFRKIVMPKATSHARSMPSETEKGKS